MSCFSAAAACWWGDVAAAEARGVRVCPPGLLADGGLGEDTTIDQLKGYVAAISTYPAGDQRMIFAGKRLEDTRTLRHYGIRAESTVHLITRNVSSSDTLRREGGDPELPSVLDVSSDARLHTACHAALIWTALAPPGEGEATCLRATPPVFLLPVLTPEASAAIITHARPGLVERRGHATAAQLGLAAFTAKLVKHVLGPAVHNLYPGVRVDADASHAFILWHAATDPDRDAIAEVDKLGLTERALQHLSEASSPAEAVPDQHGARNSQGHRLSGRGARP